GRLSNQIGENGTPNHIKGDLHEFDEEALVRIPSENDTLTGVLLACFGSGLSNCSAVRLSSDLQPR
ncbi:MAG: hypothetical protein ACR2RE_17520, partial [Geminicoccaceae bacterium]